MVDRPITALFIIHAPVFGGPHNTIAIMDRLLRLDGVETIVLLPDEAVEAAERLRAGGVEVVTMPMHRMRATLDPRVHVTWLRTLRSEVRSIAALIEERQIDVVATNSLPNLHGGLAARRANVACVWELIDSFPPPLARRFYTPIVLRLADVVMTTGVKVAAQHRGVTELGNRWVSFFPCVDTEVFTANAGARHRARSELGIPAGVTVIGNVSNLNPMKGHIHFVRAAAELRKTHPDVRFLILGASYDHYADYYQEMWSEAERLGLRLGTELVVEAPGTRVAQLAQAIDIFWMTSEPRSEGIPTVIGEAKSLGMPVVTVDVGSTSEAVSDGVSGHVVPARTPAAIAAATRELLDDPDLIKSMGAAAREEAVRDFAAQRGADAHARAYTRAIAHRRST